MVFEFRDGVAMIPGIPGPMVVSMVFDVLRLEIVMNPNHRTLSP